MLWWKTQQEENNLRYDAVRKTYCLMRVKNERTQTPRQYISPFIPLPNKLLVCFAILLLKAL